MMRLRRVYETAEEEGKPIEEIAIDRFGSLDAFEEVKEERRILDEREGNRSVRTRTADQKGRGREWEGAKGFMFTDRGGSGVSSRSSSFKRPGAAANLSTPSTPSPQSDIPPPKNRRLDSLRFPSQTVSPLAQSYTPIPSVMTPVSFKSSRALSPSSLNRLQAKVLRAKLMGSSDAEDLEIQYDAAVRDANGDGSLVAEGGVRKKVDVLPTLDARGRLYDVGHGKYDGDVMPGNRKKVEKVCCCTFMSIYQTSYACPPQFETRDPKTGDIVRYNADDDTTSLGEMLRQERFGAGMADQKDLDAQFAKAIVSDGKFQVSRHFTA
jgi:hypothetical protein